MRAKASESSASFVLARTKNRVIFGLRGGSGVSGIRAPARTALGRRCGTAQNGVSSLWVLVGGGGQEDGSWWARLMSSPA